MKQRPEEDRYARFRRYAKWSNVILILMGITEYD